MESLPELIGQAKWVLRTIWRSRLLVSISACGFGIIFALIAYVFPNKYEASSKLFVDTQSVLKPLMAGLAFQPDLELQVRMVARTLVSRPNLERLIEDPTIVGISKSSSSSLNKDVLVEDLAKKIKIEHLGANFYTLAYRDPNPAMAKAVIEGLVSLFVDSGLVTKQRDSIEASRFIEEQIKSYEDKLVKAENRLKEFKLRNFGVTGTSNQDYFARISVLSEEVSKLSISLAAAERARDAIQKELAAEALGEGGAAASSPNVPVATELDGRLEMQRRQLDELLRRYTEEHPDVVSAKRMIANLERARAQEVEKLGRSSAALNSSSSARGQVYQRLRISLADAEANVATIRTQLQGQESRLDQLKATASKVPQIEAELVQLNRDYEVTRKQYEQLVSRREAAQLGVKLDEKAQMTEFRIIEPPRVAPRPVFPDRQFIAAVGAVAAFLAGCCLALVSWRVSPTVDTSAAVQSIAKRPVIGLITWIDSTKQSMNERLWMIGYGLFLVIYIFIQIWWVSEIPSIQIYTR